MSELSLTVGGKIYQGWQAHGVTRSLRQAASAFDISLTERWPGQSEAWQILPGQKCVLAIDGEPVVTGWVNQRGPSISPEAHGVRVSGRSVTQDVVDCSAVVPGGQFTGASLDAIARALLQPFGMKVVVKTSVGEPFPRVQIQPGETCFALIERLCRLRAILVCDGADGSLVFTAAGAGGDRNAPIVEGIGGNLIGGGATITDDKRFSDYIVRGQAIGSDDVHGAAAAQVEARVKDPEVTRYRPKIVIAEGPGDMATLLARAEWEMRIAKAEALTADVTVPGWRDVNGLLWTPGNLASVQTASLGAERDLIITEVKYGMDDTGEISAITLQLPEALMPPPGSTDDPKSRGKKAAKSSGDKWRDVK